MAKKKINEKKAIQALIGLCAIVVITLSLIGDKGVLPLRELKQQEVQLIKDIEYLKTQRLEWQGQVRSLKSNQTYLETLAREQLGLVKKDELIIKFKHHDSF
ncbi:MAG: hypothetical protein COB67_07820 [SAR324 cluster bacterium]|uniref:Cell division protein FtsB n=1 Tax=SAR324 cluster bacterium TaxID=2024889 RepID=A0A2A4T2E9_9DELT|nr:MAG: hypothetical protein COB67_07820 [SAR324 cluster bacterium]